MDASRVDFVCGSGDVAGGDECIDGAIHAGRCDAFVFAEGTERLTTMRAKSEENRALAFWDVVVGSVGSNPACESLNRQPQFLITLPIHNYLA